MTKITVTPIDPTARGSYRERREVLRAYANIRAAGKTGDIDALLAAYDALEVVVLKHAQTDDGTALAEAIEAASAEEFDALIAAVLGGEETVPNPTSAPSP